MVIVKILERKGIIRLFGLALILAPLVDNYISAFVLPRGAPPWSSQAFWKMVSSRTNVEQLLFVASFFVGFLMLKGASWSWKVTLVLLGGHIAHQTANFGQNYRTNSISVLFFVINVSIFLFVADQLAWRQKISASGRPPPPKLPVPILERSQVQSFTKTPQTAGPIPTGKNTDGPPPTVLFPMPAMVQAMPPAAAQAPQSASAHPQIQTQPPRLVPVRPIQTQKRILVNFEGFGNWAQLVNVSSNGIQVRCLAPPPAGIESREIELSLPSGLNLRIRFANQTGSDMYFIYQQLSTGDTQLLNQWLLRQAA